MKKIVCVLSALTLMTSPLSAYADTAITESAAEKQAETQLTMEVAPTYTVVIPADIKIEEGETFTHFGDLYLEQRVLEPGHLVNVAVDGDFEMKNFPPEERRTGGGSRGAEGSQSRRAPAVRRTRGGTPPAPPAPPPAAYSPPEGSSPRPD